MNLDNMISQLSREGAKKKFLSPWQVLGIWAGLFLTYGLGVFVFFPLRADIVSKVGEPYFLLHTLAILLVMVSASVSASYLALPDANQKAWVRNLPLLPLGVLAVMLLKAFTTLMPTHLADYLDPHAFACAKAVALFGLAPAAIMFYTIQKAAPLRRYWAGSMAGLSGSGMGYFLLLLVEPHDNPTHVLFWHFSPVLLSMLIAMALGNWILGRWERG